MTPGAGVVVVGGGVAGSGAALSAARAGARVTLVDAGAGASTLWTGALDPADPPPDEVRVVAASLGVVLGSGAVATTAGLVRRVSGREAAILDLAPLLVDHGDRAVGVVRCERPGWDADALVRAAGGGLFAIDATILRLADERLVPDADFAARHDDEGRLGWLSDRLREGAARARRSLHALLLPPSLGLDRARASELSERVHVPCGEATAMPGGPAGLRFERARDRALASAGVTVVQGRAVCVEAAAGAAERWRVCLEDRELEADAVVLAAGGLVGGGLVYQPSEAILSSTLPPTARVAFRCGLEAPVRIGAHGKPWGVPGSLFGVAPESIAWPLSRDRLMDRVGILCDGGGRAAARLYAAGEIVADAPRTWLAALEGGVRAGAAAAHDAGGVKAPAARPSSRAAAPASRP